jgi:hypothetical protein
LANDVVGPADSLAGTWNLAGASDLGFTGFSPFANLSAGSTLSGLVVELETSTVGAFAGQLVLNSRSQNAGGFDGALADVTISFVGVIELAGDYNDDGTVDAADYTVWRDSLGQSGAGLAADGNTNNQIDTGDYTVWKSNFGQSATGGGSIAGLNAAVPEPATFVLLIFVFAGRCLCRPRYA